MELLNTNVKIRCEMGACKNIAAHSIKLDRVGIKSQIHICDDCLLELHNLVADSIEIRKGMAENGAAKAKGVMAENGAAKAKGVMAENGAAKAKGVMAEKGIAKAKAVVKSNKIAATIKR